MSMRELLKLKRIWILILIPFTIICMIVADANEYIAEHVFAERIYKILSKVIGTITGWIPFSLAEIIVILIPFTVVGFIIFAIVKIVKSKTKGRLLIRYSINVLCTFAIIFCMYELLCGINYNRYSFTKFSGLEVKESTKEELYEMCVDLADRASQLRTQFEEYDSPQTMAVESDKAYANLEKLYPVLSGYKGEVKPVFLSKYMSYTEIVGIFFPFTMESNVNTDIYEYNIPANMCHELAHLRGFMREEEANYIAYLACVNSDNIQFQYSGVTMALIYSMNTLYREDEELYAKMREHISEQVLVEFSADAAYWRDIRSTKIGNKVAEVSNQVNDTYLKANGQENGVKSYGKMIDLLLAQYRKDKAS